MEARSESQDPKRWRRLPEVRVGIGVDARSGCEEALGMSGRQGDSTEVMISIWAAADSRE